MKVVIIDDQAVVRNGLCTILEGEEEIEVVGEASNGKEAIGVISASQPDVVLMDVRMPIMDGVEATRLISSRTSVLLLTTFDVDEHIFEGLEAGASGFLLKDCTPEQLVNAVRAVASGEAVLTTTVMERLVERVSVRRARQQQNASSIESLTARENDVLALMVRGLSNSDIAGELFLSEATVKTHVGRIFAKMNVKDRTQAVVKAYESGLA